MSPKISENKDLFDANFFPQKFFVARQPILNSHLEVKGYELLFRSGAGNEVIAQQ